MNGEIDFPREQRFLDLLDEKALASDPRQGHVQDHVPRRLYLHDLGFFAGPALDFELYELGLPQGELAPPAAETDRAAFMQSPLPLFPVPPPVAAGRRSRGGRT